MQGQQQVSWLPVRPMLRASRNGCFRLCFCASCHLLPALGQHNPKPTGKPNPELWDRRQLIPAVPADMLIFCLCRGTSRLGGCRNTQAQGVGKKQPFLARVVAREGLCDISSKEDTVGVQLQRLNTAAVAMAAFQTLSYPYAGSKKSCTQVCSI